jgi:predicted P-loop ATPase
MDFQHVLDMHYRGFAVFPVYIDPASGNKIPKWKGWQNLVYDPFVEPKETDFQGSTAYGVVLTGSYLVVDADLYKPEGRDSYGKITSRFPLKPTFSVETGRGGRHDYFRIPRTTPLKKTFGEYRGVDFLSAHSYAVGPGSETGVGFYRIINDAPIANAPIELIEAIRKHHIATDEPIRSYTDLVELPDSYQRYVAYLQTASPSIIGQLGDDNAYKVCAVGKDLGLPPDRIVEALLESGWSDRCDPPRVMEFIEAKARNVWEYGVLPAGVRNVEFDEITDEPVLRKHTLTYDEHHQLKKRDKNNWFLLTQIEVWNGEENKLRGLFKHNQLTDEIEFNFIPPWARDHKQQKLIFDKDGQIAMTFYYSDKFKIEISDKEAYAVARKAALMNSYNPWHLYLEGLVWDQKPRIQELWSRYCGAKDNEYTRESAFIFCMALVYRIMEPGTKFDSMPILEGVPNIGKSLFCKVLAGEKYTTAVSFALDNNEINVRADGMLIVEFPELDGWGKKDVNTAKALISDETPKINKKYFAPEVRPRTCVFVGTMNPRMYNKYLMDETGNRRFWPIECGDIKLEELKKDRDQLFAEMYYWYMSKKYRNKLFLTSKKALDILAELHKNRLVSFEDSSEYERLIPWLSSLEPGYKFTTADALVRALSIPETHHTMTRRRQISGILSSLGYTRVRDAKTIYWMKEPE